MNDADWIDVAATSEVAPGVILGVHINGRELVVWRGDDGVVALQDARCPHEWTHLAGQGVVEGCELICLAHFWRFDREGNAFLQGTSGHREVVPHCRVRVE